MIGGPPVNVGPVAPAPSAGLLTSSVTVSLSSEEKARVAAAAKAAGLSMSAYCRRAILKETP